MLFCDFKCSRSIENYCKGPGGIDYQLFEKASFRMFKKGSSGNTLTLKQECRSSVSKLFLSLLFYATLQYGKFPFDCKNTLLCDSTRLCPVGMTWMPIPLFDSKMQTSLIDVVPCFFFCHEVPYLVNDCIYMKG